MKNKVVIVTGGLQGIGKSIQERLLHEGYKVVVFDLQESVGKEKLPFDYIRCDVSKESEVQAAIAEIKQRYGQIDGVVNNAGIIADKVIWKMSLEEFERVINVNLKGTWLMCREAVRIMKEQKGGKIINISSRAWLGNPGQTNYSASKAGIIGMSRALALEIGQYNISVNVIAPGLIETDLTRSLPPHVREKLIRAQPQKNIGKPEDVAHAVSFLLDEQTHFINGQVLYIDGGKCLGASLTI